MTPTRPTKGAGGTDRYTRRSQAPLAAQVAAVTGLAIASAGCAEPLAPIRLPFKAAARSAAVGTSSAKTAPSVMTTRQQILASLAGYMTALGQAEDSRSGAVARELLRPYLAPDRIDGLVQAMTAIWAGGESFNGKDIRHVSNVTVVGRYAFVHDCDNTSGMALVDIATAQLVAGSSGTSRVNLVTRLNLVGGHWLVEFQLVEDVPCTP
jgi:hypothetical protein